MIKKLIFSTIFLLSVLATQHSFSQNLAEYNWLFGNSDRVIIFNKGTNQAQIDSIQVTPFGTGGSAVISDPLTADILFYTDGNDVYDTNHELLPNGSGLEADPSINQAAAVIPFTYTDGRYLLFTNPGSAGSNEILYSIIDKNLMGNANVGLGEPARGDISAKNQPTGLTNPSDGMITIEGDAPNQHWLITNDRTTFEYKVLQVNDGVPDIGGIQTFNLATPSIPGFVASAFAYNQDSLLLAVAPKDQNRNIVLLDFDPANGTLALNSQILNTGNSDFATEAIYDLEWSANGSKLYVSRHGTTTGNNGNLYQVALDDSLLRVNPILFSPVFRSYGVQRGPDRRVYHLYQLNDGSDLEVGRVNQADSLYSADSVRFNVFYDSLVFGNQNFAGTQFPSFPAPNFEEFDSLDFVYLDTCAETSTKFFPFVSPHPQRYFWDFGDGSTSNAHSPIHTYQSPGVYPVALTVFSNEVRETVTKNVNITTNDLMVDLGADTVICPGETLLLDAGPGAVSYAWNTLESTQTIEIDTTGYYWVSAVSATGCATYDQIQVTTYGDDATRYNQWYFGEMAGIDFNNGTTPITDDNLMTSPVAASSISDANGELLFYTNGVSVWNQEHELMVNGDNIGGDSTSVQGAMIVPVPGDSTIFYVFTTDPVWGDYSYDIRYAMVDIKKDTARGEVILKDRPLYMNSTERMTATAIGGSLVWLITHEYGNNVFRAYPITADGIGASAISAAGSVHRFSEERNGTASIKVDPGGRRVAVALQDSTENYVELFSFADSTGMVDDFIQLDIMESVPSLAYGVEFSSSLQRLYVTTNGNGSKLIQYDLDSIDTEDAKIHIEATKFEVANSSEEYGTIQTGPDGIVYMAVENSPALGTINNPNGDDIQSSFVETGFDLAGRISRLGLPNFVQQVSNPPNTPGITYEDACIGNPTVFTASTTSMIDVVFWTFGDGTNSDSTTVNHTYNEVDVYDVSLNISNRCGLDSTFYATVEVFATPPNPTVPLATTICNGPEMLAAWPSDTTAFTYNWSTGDTSRVITVDQRSTLEVFITDINGCVSETVESLVDDTRPVVDIGQDFIVCQDEFVQDFDALNPGATYIWSLDGVNNGNTLRTQRIDTSVPGFFTYKIEVEDIFQCIGEDSVTMEVIDTPIFTAVPTDATGCGTADGQISLDIGSTGSFTYELNGPTIVGAANTTGPNAVLVSNALEAGAYVLLVENTVSGCQSFLPMAVGEPAPFDLTPTPMPACGDEGDIEIALSIAATTPVTYDLLDVGGAVVRNNVSTTPTAAQPFFSIDDLPIGTYSVEVTDNSTGCLQTAADIVLVENPAAAFTVTPQSICGDAGDVSVFPEAANPVTVSYIWTGPNITSIDGSNIGETVTANEAGTYSVSSSDAAGILCPQTSDVPVDQTDDPIVEIVATGDPCTGQVTLEAGISNSSGGNLGFQWEDGSNSSQLVVTSTGNYEVTVLDQGSGCQNIGDIDVEVFSEITVFIRAEPNCDDNSEVFLTAIANITEDVTFEWTDPFGQVIPDAGAIISATTSGNYSVTVAGTNNTCSATDDIDVLIIPILEDQLLLGGTQEFCSKDPDPANSVLILDPGLFSSYEWRLLNEDPIISEDRLYEVMDAGVYEVTLNNGLTCIRDVVEIVDDCDPLIVAPNAFTPDSSPGLNDTFFVFPNPYVTDFQIYIYSRHGELVFQSTDVDFQWNGLYRGGLLQTGTYAYVMRYKSTLDLERGIIEQHGGVMLLR
ncbi:MAG: gliding motility-associated C-terminal domain-containing protein [Cyclobacteriaceae bacterium]